MATYRYVVVDVFTDTALQGNQLAVFTDAREVPEEMLQPLAKEMNFSESVFVLPAEQGGHARIRIFTPVTELPFAGHPVLGSAFVLAAPMQLGEIKLETLVGVIPIVLEREGARITFGWMQQPIPQHEPFSEADAVQELLGIRSQLPALAMHLARHGRIGFGEQIEISQGDEVGRPSKLFAHVTGAPERVETIEVGGSAVTVARGEFRL